MMRVQIEWKKYGNFFELREAHKRDTHLLYIIGDQPLCYIGSIGSMKGQQGIGTRYQAQYLKLAKAIFGLPEESGKICFAGTIMEPSGPEPALIYAVEGELQQIFIEKHGLGSALFDPIGRLMEIALDHRGDKPPYI